MAVTRETITIPARPAQIVAGGTTSIPVIVVDSNTPTVVNPSVLTGVESSYTFPAGTTNYSISTHQKAGFRLGFATGIFVATPYRLIKHTYEKNNLNPSTTYTVYFGPVAKDVVFEIESWK